MEHNICRENLSAYLDGELRPEEKAQLEAHLAGCPDCRTALGQLESVSVMVKQHAMEPVPLSLKKAVLDGRTPARPWLKPALAFSAAAAGLLVVFNLTRPEKEVMDLGFAMRASTEYDLEVAEPAAEQAAPAEAPAAPPTSLYSSGAGKTGYAAPVAAARGNYAQAKFAAPRAAGSLGTAAAVRGGASPAEFRGRVAVQVSLPGQASAGMHSALAFLRGTGTPLTAAAPGRLVFIKNDGSRVTLTEADCAYGIVLFDGSRDPLVVADPAALPAAYSGYFGAAPGR